MAAGLRRLEIYPPACKWADPLRGRSHAHHVMAIHAGHRCPRYAMAVDYLKKVSWS
ncbi:hypothetical protein ACRS6B_11835 [Nocardia asteroides]